MTSRGFPLARTARPDADGPRPDGPSSAPVRPSIATRGRGSPPATQSGLRLRNLWAVLEYIRRAGPTTRVRIGAETGLTGTTVHRLTDELVRRGLVVPVAVGSRSAVGRPPVMFRFDAAAGHVLGIDVGNETTRAVIADLSGTVLGHSDRPTSSIEADLPGAIRETAAALQRAAAVSPGSLVAAGVGVAAVTEAEGTIVRASMHHLWEGLHLGLELQRDLGCEVLVSQDDHLAALAEHKVGGCVGLRDALVVNIGKGIGAGVIADGAVYRGAHGAAGRVGWMPTMAEAIVAAGAPGPVPPVLASLLSADGLISEYRRLGGTGRVEGARDVFEADAEGDVAACEAIDRFADRLGWLLGSAIAMMDPQRVVVGGGISGSFARLAPRVSERVGQIVAVSPPIVASTLGPGAVIRGAIASALKLADAWLLTRLKI